MYLARGTRYLLGMYSKRSELEIRVGIRVRKTRKWCTQYGHTDSDTNSDLLQYMIWKIEVEFVSVCHTCNRSKLNCGIIELNCVTAVRYSSQYPYSIQVPVLLVPVQLFSVGESNSPPINMYSYLLHCTVPIGTAHSKIFNFWNICYKNDKKIEALHKKVQLATLISTLISNSDLWYGYLKRYLFRNHIRVTRLKTLIRVYAYTQYGHTDSDLQLWSLAIHP